MAKTVGEPAVLHGLLRRLGTIRLDGLRRWGTLTPHEMLCHLGDATDMALGVRPRKGEAPDRSRPLVKLMGLWAPIRGFFGSMSVRDWQRWAYRHTNHHLRQFGV